MHWLYFSSSRTKFSGSIEKDLLSLLGPDRTSIRYGIKSLESFLKSPHPILTHALILIHREEDLRAMKSLRLQLADLRLLLGFVSRNMPACHREIFQFVPRFVACLPSEEENLRCVMQKMIQNHFINTKERNLFMNHTPSTPPATGAAENRPRAGKFLTFFLGSEEYGLEILKAKEVMGMLSITPIPGSPQSYRGVINLRGKMIPVVDLRHKFGMAAAPSKEENCIIVVQSGDALTGLVVDRVSDVSYIDDKDMESVPSMGSAGCAGYLLGIGKSSDRVRLLLDIDQVLAVN